MKRDVEDAVPYDDRAAGESEGAAKRRLGFDPLSILFLQSKKRIDSSAGYDRYQTELPKIREKKGGKQGEKQE